MAFGPWRGQTPGGNSLYYGTSTPSAAADGTFRVGDEIRNTAPTAAGTHKWVCTTAGNGATSVWKAVATAA